MKLKTRRPLQPLLFLAAAACSIFFFCRSCLGQSNIQKALTISKGIGDRDAVLATKYIHPTDFKQHNLGAYDGVDGLKGFISHLPPGKSPLTVVRVFQGGPYVFTQSEGNLFGPKVFFDIYRFQNGLIVEHWDNLADATPTNRSGHTPAEEPTQAIGVQDTEKNKAFVRGFYKVIFLNGQFDKMGNYFDDTFIRHDASGSEGPLALKVLMHKQARKSVVMKVGKMEQLLGEGNFVLVTASGSIVGKPVAYYDLFRVKNGKIAENWNVTQDIPTETQRKNQNSKF